jgi:hypothetical protein
VGSNGILECKFLSKKENRAATTVVPGAKFSTTVLWIVSMVTTGAKSLISINVTFSVVVEFQLNGQF